MSGSGISWAICKSPPCSRQTTMPTPHHSVFTGRMPFLPPNQQRQSTEGKQYNTTWEINQLNEIKLDSVESANQKLDHADSHQPSREKNRPVSRDSSMTVTRRSAVWMIRDCLWPEHIPGWRVLFNKTWWYRHCCRLYRHRHLLQLHNTLTYRKAGCPHVLDLALHHQDAGL